eukprot:Gb_26467 [translate_table: standard]
MPQISNGHKLPGKFTFCKAMGPPPATLYSLLAAFCNSLQLQPYILARRRSVVRKGKGLIVQACVQYQRLANPYSANEKYGIGNSWHTFVQKVAQHSDALFYFQRYSEWLTRKFQGLKSFLKEANEKSTQKSFLSTRFQGRLYSIVGIDEKHREEVADLRLMHELIELSLSQGGLCGEQLQLNVNCWTHRPLPLAPFLLSDPPLPGQC